MNIGTIILPACLRSRLAWFISLALSLHTAALAAPPANDAFASRALLRGSDITHPFNMAGATQESWEHFPDGRSDHPTVWWTWTAPQDGVVFLDMSGNCTGKTCPPTINLFTRLGESMTLIATNEGVYPTRETQIRFEARQNQAYIIRASDHDNPSMVLRLQHFAVRMVAPVNNAVVKTGSNVLLRVSPLTVAMSNVTQIDFRTVNSRLLGSATTPPFEYIWTNPPPGRHYVAASPLVSDGSTPPFIPGVLFEVRTQEGSASLMVEHISFTGATVRLTGTYGIYYEVQSSPNLIQWNTFATGWLDTNSVILQDYPVFGPGWWSAGNPPTNGLPHVFYRLRPSP